MIKKQYPFAKQVNTYHLLNGLTAVLVPDNSFTVCNAGIVFNIGSMDSHTKIALKDKEIVLPLGIAHFLEHRMFDFKEGPVFELFSKLGAVSNAYTSFDKTAYYFTGTDQPEKAIKLLLDFTSQFDVTSESVEVEKPIIVEELKMYQDQPSDMTMLGILKNLYHHNMIREDIGGTQEEVEATTLEMLKAAHSYFYHPRNAIIYVTGNFDHDKILKQLRKFRFPILDKVQAIKPQFIEPETIVKSESKIEMEVATKCIGIGIKMLEPNQENYLREVIALNMLLELLFSTTSPLYNQMIEKEIISEVFTFSYEVVRDTAQIFFYAETDEIDKFKEVILSALADPLPFLTKKELTKVRNAMSGSQLRSLNTPSGILGALMNQAFAPSDVFKDTLMIPKIRMYDIIKATKQIDLKKVSVFLVEQSSI